MSGVPQGSVEGPFLFNAYVPPIGRVIDSFEVGYHSYANDTQLYAALRSTPASNFDRLSNCSPALQHWFWSNDLLLNPDRSEAEFFGTKPDLRKPGLPSSISVTDCPIAVSERLKILGVMLDSSLSFDDHVNAVVRACNYHI